MTQHALFQLGMDLEDPSTAQTEDFRSDASGSREPEARQAESDFFVVKDGVRCAGRHLIIDMHGADRLDDPEFIERALRQCVERSGATLLHIHLHHFTPNQGVSGVAVLAESHISIHSWPEHRFAALDVFMCGETDPEACVLVLEEWFGPERLEVNEILRGTDV